MAIGIGVSVAKSPVLNRLYEAKAYSARVLADSGEVANNAKLRELILMLKAQGLYDSTKLLIAPVLGGKWRTSGIYKYASKLYSVNLAANDATQTAEVSQPYQAGNIAPTELLSIKNPNGDTRYLSHPAISFAANEAWSVSFMGNNNANKNIVQGVIGKGSDTQSIIAIPRDPNKIRFANESGVSIDSNLGATNPYYGKNTLYSFVADGLNKLSIYINSVKFQDLTVETNINISRFLKGLSSAGYEFNGTSHYYRIQSGAMTAGQITAEYNLLRSWIPEIESVQIGTQTWATSNLAAVATPLGNVIPEVQLAATWATATTLYDAAYAAAAGDAAAKHYAGVKAAAMWCHYDNSTANGAVYGKIMNGYAKELLNLDFISASYGWRIPTEAEKNTLLATYIDANDLKMSGVNYWDNALGTNLSGLTLLGTGCRMSDGSFASIKKVGGFHTSDGNLFKQIGLPIRLIKI